MTSTNEHANAAYNKLRAKLLYSLRLINDIADPDEEKFRQRDLEADIKALQEVINILENEELRLDILLRDRKISGTIATSLMNDTAQVKSMVKSLADIVIIFKTYQDGEIAQMAQIAQNEEEEIKENK